MATLRGVLKILYKLVLLEGLNQGWHKSSKLQKAVEQCMKKKLSGTLFVAHSRV